MWLIGWNGSSCTFSVWELSQPNAGFQTGNWWNWSGEIFYIAQTFKLIFQNMLTCGGTGLETSGQTNFLLLSFIVESQFRSSFPPPTPHPHQFLHKFSQVWKVCTRISKKVALIFLLCEQNVQIWLKATSHFQHSAHQVKYRSATSFFSMLPQGKIKSSDWPCSQLCLAFLIFLLVLNFFQHGAP